MTDLIYVVISISTARCSYSLAATVRAVDEGARGENSSI